MSDVSRAIVMASAVQRLERKIEASRPRCCAPSPATSACAVPTEQREALTNKTSIAARSVT
jgi:hypothetical protein